MVIVAIKGGLMAPVVSWNVCVRLNCVSDIRRQMNDQLGCLDLRMDSKLSLLAEFQEFFKKRGEVEYEYARSLERLCEKFERSTKQRNLRSATESSSL